MPYHFNSTSLMPGSVILPGNWGRIVMGLGRFHTLYKREMALESARQAEFLNKPSRLHSAYFFDTQQMAEAYGRADALRFVTLLLYEVELLDPDAPQHRADWSALPSNDAPEADVAQRYWHGYEHSLLDGASGRVEVLSPTPLRIVQTITYGWNP